MKYLPVLMILMGGCGAPLQTVHTSPNQNEASLCVTWACIDLRTRSLVLGPNVFRLSDIQPGQAIGMFAEGFLLDAERMERKPSISVSAGRLGDRTVEFEATLEPSGSRWVKLQPVRGQHAVLALPAEYDASHLFIFGIDDVGAP